MGPHAVLDAHSGAVGLGGVRVSAPAKQMSVRGEDVSTPSDIIGHQSDGTGPQPEQVADRTSCDIKQISDTP